MYSNACKKQYCLKIKKKRRKTLCSKTSYNVNVGPGGFTTVSRSKQNDSSLYISHQGDRGVNVGVFSGGVNYSANGGYYYVAAGTSAYLPSYVNESGKSSCYLHLIPSPASSCHLYGHWRQDSK